MSKNRWHLIENWKQGHKLYSTQWHILGLILSAFSTGMSLVYGSSDSIQHGMLPSWLNYLILFSIFLGAFIGRFIKQ